MRPVIVGNEASKSHDDELIDDWTDADREVERKFPCKGCGEVSCQLESRLEIL
jgi:hypothetical protein